MVAALFQVAPRTVVKWCDGGLLDYWKIPGGAHRGGNGEARDRRIPRAALVAFCEREGVPVPAVLMGGRAVCCLTGAVPGVQLVDRVALGVLAGQRVLGRAVLGCEVGLGAAAEAAVAVRAACPGVRLCLVLPDDFPEADVPTGAFDRVVRACEPGALVEWLVGG